MIYALVIALLIQGCAFAYLIDRITTRNDAQVQALCQRLQAPETAVAEHAIQGFSPEPPYLPYEDDQAFMTYSLEQRG